MSQSRIVKRLVDLGCEAKIDGDRIEVDVEEAKIYIPIEDEWDTAIKSFYKARQYKYNPDKGILTSNRAAEFLVVRLDPGFYYRVKHTFSDAKENTVVLSKASKEYQLSSFESEHYGRSFNRVKSRILSRFNRPTVSGRRRSNRIRFRLEDLFFMYHTVTYSAKRKPKGQNIEEVAIGPVKACLFSLAYKKDESWELSHEIKAKGLIYPKIDKGEDGDLVIPRAYYEDATVTFYKVAKSSQYPSQVFLAYYHILEYHYLRVADEALFNAVCAQLNDPEFRSTYENVTKLMAAIKRNDNTSSEKDMLLGVLRKYVAEEEFVDFVKNYEESCGDKVFTKSKQVIFGERLPFSLEKGHALNNAAGIIKHIRNALVHSSDKYSREDCFLPLSESEDLIVKYLPLVRYLAERVIFATANT